MESVTMVLPAGKRTMVFNKISARCRPGIFAKVHRMNQAMRLTIPVLVLLWLVPLGNCVTGKHEDTSNAISVPFESYGTMILIPVRVNDSAPLTFIFDTGINVLSINPKRAPELHLGQSKEVHDGPLKLALTKATLQIGSARLEHVKNVSGLLSFDDLEAAFGRTVDGIIGFDVLQRYVVEVDYEDHTLNLYDPKSYHYNGHEQPIPLKFKNRISSVQCQLIPSMGEPVTANLDIDTGSDSAIKLHTAFVRDHKLLENAGSTIPSSTWTAAGELEVRLGRLKALRVGRFTFNAPLARFSTSTQEKPWIIISSAGLVGGEVLQRFKLILDYRHKWIVLEPNVHLEEAFEWDMSGMILIADADSSTYAVSEVMAQSPAAEAGLQKGDHVTAIDGQAVTTQDHPDFDRLFKQEGREIQLQIERDKQGLEIKLKLRRLI